MDSEKFWSMIDEARQESGGNISRQLELLTEALSRLSIEDIAEFDRLLWTMMAQAYRTDLWEAVYLVACGCGDDAFEDFRGWLIAQGRNIFETVLQDPQNLADIVDKKDRLDFFDGRMTSVAQELYEQKTGNWPPDTDDSEPAILIGGHLWPKSELPAKFPRLWAKFGDCSDEEQFDD